MDPETLDIFENVHLLACRCGLTHRLAETQVGVPLECPHCGEVFLVPRAGQGTEPIPLVGAEQDEKARLEADLCPRTPGGMLTRADVQFDPPAEVVIEDAEYLQRQEAIKEARRGSQFRRDLAWNLLFFADARNVGPMFVIWLLVTIEIAAVRASIGSPVFMFMVFALILAGMIEGLIGGMMLHTVEGASTGAEDVARLPSFDDLLAEWPRHVIEPLLLSGATGIVALGPGLTVLSVAWAKTPVGASLPLDAWVASGLVLVVGMIFWPVLILAAVHGEIGDLLRFDLMVRTIRATVGAYLWTLAYAAFGLLLTGVALVALVLINSPLIPTGFLLAMLLAGVRCYGQVVVMRGIGLFARHYKRRFAWNWA
ncbi:MAG: hypothetical protein IT449_02545 [Phycisphaerales bacterium]|nr:hypothetical protein [Phycisphaerales bacterium]